VITAAAKPAQPSTPDRLNRDRRRGRAPATVAIPIFSRVMAPPKPFEIDGTGDAEPLLDIAPEQAQPKIRRHRTLIMRS